MNEQKLEKSNLSSKNKSEKELTKAEKDHVLAFFKKISEDRPPRFLKTENNQIKIDGLLNEVKFTEAMGAKDTSFAASLFNQLIQVVRSQDGEGDLQSCNTLAAVLHSLKPKDELEGMLFTQMTSAHHLAMEFLRRAILKNQTVDGVDTNVNRATKLLRTFTAQMEALNRYRGKGQQKVTVKHVHVHEGGKAIVGQVQSGGRGKNENCG